MVRPAMAASTMTVRHTRATARASMRSEEEQADGDATHGEGDEHGLGDDDGFGPPCREDDGEEGDDAGDEKDDVGGVGVARGDVGEHHELSPPSGSGASAGFSAGPGP